MGNSRGEAAYTAERIRLREYAVAAYLRRFKAAIKSVDNALITCAFVFPSRFAPMLQPDDDLLSESVRAVAPRAKAIGFSHTAAPNPTRAFGL